jgi:hypothetical protein
MNCGTSDYITPEEYMEMRKLVEWSEFPLEQAALAELVLDVP